MADINWPDSTDRRLIGKRIDRTDGPIKAAGSAKYTYDIERPGMLYAKVLCAPIAAGVLRSIDTRPAETMRGVEAVHVITQPGAAINWAGQEIAAVAAISEELAAEAVHRIRAVFDRSEPQMDDTDPGKAEGRARTREKGDPDQAFGEADAVIEARYGIPVITHC